MAISTALADLSSEGSDGRAADNGFLSTFSVDKESPAELEDVTDVTGQPSADTEHEALQSDLI